MNSKLNIAAIVTVMVLVVGAKKS